MSELHEQLEQSMRALGIAGEVPRLREAARLSQETLDRAREWLQVAAPFDKTDDGLDVLVFGSYARSEASGPSDFDYLVVAHKLPEEHLVDSSRTLLAAVQRYVARELGEAGDGTSAAPGATGLFGRIASAPDLSERIGLEQDTNASHTRRLLLLQESTSIYRGHLRRNLMKTILARYRTAAREMDRPPRFLINDFIRYWYTLAVDYQAKRWERNDRGWGLRYLKLISSRKLTYAGTMASLLRFGPDRPATTDALVAEFEKPPLTRLAQLALEDRFRETTALRQVLLFAERFADFLASTENRQAVAAVESLKEAEANPTFWQMRQEARAMDEHLKSVFLGSILGEATRKYLIF